MKTFTRLLLFIVAFVVYPALSQAGTYRSTSQVVQRNESGTNIGYAYATGGTPPDTCASIVAIRGPYFSGGEIAAGYHYTCSWQKVGGPNAYEVNVVENSGGSRLYTVSVTAIEGGEACWEGRGTFGWESTAGGGCSPCPDPEEWNDATKTCDMPDCDSGEIWDEEISACRPTCESSEFYNYDAAACKAKCPSGMSSPYMMMSNKADIGMIATSTVNGCPVQRHYQCVIETQEDAYYHGAEFTGNVCMSWWTFQEAMVEYDVISQEEYCAETGACEGYTGEGHEPEFLGLASVPNLNMEPVALGGSVAIEIEASHFLCLGGTYRLVTTVNGSPSEVEFFGACPGQDVEPIPPGPSSNAYEARLESKVDAVADTGDEIKTLIDTVMDLVEEVKGTTTQVAQSMGIMASGEEPPAEFAGPDVGAVYEAEHENGLDGVVQDAQDDLTGTSALEDWMDGLVPILPEAGATCPSWSFQPPMLNIAPVTFEPDCRVWDWLKALFYVGTVAACYGIVLGRRA